MEKRREEDVGGERVRKVSGCDIQKERELLKTHVMDRQAWTSSFRRIGRSHTLLPTNGHYRPPEARATRYT